MVKAFGSRSRRKKYLLVTKGFLLSKSHNYRSSKQQFVHSGSAAYTGLKLKKRYNRIMQTKLWNLFLRTKGTHYAKFKKVQKQRACALNIEQLREYWISMPYWLKLFILENGDF